MEPTEEVVVKKSRLENLLGDMFPANQQSANSSSTDIREVVTKQLVYYDDQPVPPLSSDPLRWWEENSDRCSLLSKLARQYLVVQGTSVPSERVFSTCGDTVNQKRSCLTGEHVSEIVFLNINRRLY